MNNLFFFYEENGKKLVAVTLFYFGFYICVQFFITIERITKIFFYFGRTVPLRPQQLMEVITRLRKTGSVFPEKGTEARQKKELGTTSRRRQVLLCENQIKNISLMKSGFA